MAIDPKRAADVFARKQGRPRATAALVLVENRVYSLPPARLKRLLLELGSQQVGTEPAGPALLSEATLAANGKLLGTAQPVESLACPPPKEPARKNGKKGPPRTHGRFDTREELLERAWFYRMYTNMSAPDIARNLKISTTTLTKLFDRGEGKPLEEPPAEISVGATPEDGAKDPVAAGKGTAP